MKLAQLKEQSGESTQGEAVHNEGFRRSLGNSWAIQVNLDSMKQQRPGQTFCIVMASHSELQQRAHTTCCSANVRRATLWYATWQLEVMQCSEHLMILYPGFEEETISSMATWRTLTDFLFGKADRINNSSAQQRQQTELTAN